MVKGIGREVGQKQRGGAEERAASVTEKVAIQKLWQGGYAGADRCVGRDEFHQDIRSRTSGDKLYRYVFIITKIYAKPKVVLTRFLEY